MLDSPHAQGALGPRQSSGTCRCNAWASPANVFGNPHTFQGLGRGSYVEIHENPTHGTAFSGCNFVFCSGHAPSGQNMCKIFGGYETATGFWKLNTLVRSVSLLYVNGRAALMLNTFHEREFYQKNTLPSRYDFAVEIEF
jgi:hypothetical protein